ncbi:MAG: TetR/AcrR family transcriptional regulator [Candidatus Marinimicrobia bacterium]|nr:TetR/AcrR family transcriptional regulator [Candidatus Neomarinimicrobiota bacterium]
MYSKITPQEKQILEQGFDSIMEEGLRGFTVEALSHRLRMSKKTIYKFFPTKEVLIKKIMQFITGRIAGRIQTIRSEVQNPAIQFVKIMEFIVGFVGRVPLQRMTELKVRYPALWSELEKFRLARRDDFYTILSEAQQQGLVRSDLDMKVVATIYINLVNSTFQPEFFFKNNLAPEDTIRTFVKMITTGLFTDKGIQHVETI